MQKINIFRGVRGYYLDNFSFYRHKIYTGCRMHKEREDKHNTAMADYLAAISDSIQIRWYLPDISDTLDVKNDTQRIASRPGRVQCSFFSGGLSSEIYFYILQQLTTIHEPYKASDLEKKSTAEPLEPIRYF